MRRARLRSLLPLLAVLVLARCTTLKDVKLESELLLKTGAVAPIDVTTEAVLETTATVLVNNASDNVIITAAGTAAAPQAPGSTTSATVKKLTEMVPDRDEDDDNEEEQSRDSTSHQKTSGIFNFASHTAGAVVLGHSPSARGFQNLLDDDMDRYGISPCNEKKWVVIGLSEDILVTSVVLANFEKYSSFLKDFQLLASTVYPTEEWINLGTYTAQPRLGEQTFNVTQTSTHCRYVKFKFISHYDSEALCTVSQIKVHGQTVIASFKEEVEMSDNQMRSMLHTLTDESADANVIEAAAQEILAEAQALAQAQDGNSSVAVDTIAAENQSAESTSVPSVVSDETNAAQASSISVSESESSAGDFVTVANSTEAESVTPTPPDNSAAVTIEQSNALPAGQNKAEMTSESSGVEESKKGALGLRIETVVRSVKEIVTPLLSQLKDSTAAVKESIANDAISAVGVQTASDSVGGSERADNATAPSSPILDSESAAAVPSATAADNQPGKSEEAATQSSEAATIDGAMPADTAAADVVTGAEVGVEGGSGGGTASGSSSNTNSSTTDVATSTTVDSFGVTVTDVEPNTGANSTESASASSSGNDTAVPTASAPQGNIATLLLQNQQQQQQNVSVATDDNCPADGEGVYNSTAPVVNVIAAANTTEEGASRQIVIAPEPVPFTSIACQDIMRFPDFQAKMLAKLQQAAKEVVPPLSGGNENVYKRLMTKVNALEMSHKILDIYMSQVSECYRSVILEKSSERSRAEVEKEAAVRRAARSVRDRWILVCCVAALAASIVAIIVCAAVYVRVSSSLLPVGPVSASATVPVVGDGVTQAQTKEISRARSGSSSRAGRRK